MEDFDYFKDCIEYKRLCNLTYSNLEDEKIINEVVKFKNPWVFDSYIKRLEFKTDTGKIFEKRNKYIKKILLNLKKEDLCSYFGLPESKSSIANRFIAEYIVSYYFQDNYYNFMVNLFQMTNYLNNTKKDLVDKFHLDIYKEFVDLIHMSFEDKILFFKLFLNEMNLMEMFYDDLTKVREDSHKELVNCITKLDQNSALYQKDLSDKLKVPVYYLNGEKFYGFVRGLSIKTSEKKDKSDYIYSTDNRVGYSFSFVGNLFFGTIDYTKKNVLLYYDNIDYKRIMYVHHSDMSTGVQYVQKSYLTECENEILSPNILIGKTKNYSEVLIKPGEDGIKPTALVCYDTISKNDVSFAKRYNLSILLVNTKKYYMGNEEDMDYQRYTYVLR